jgi:hypothetical protein
MLPLVLSPKERSTQRTLVAISISMITSWGRLQPAESQLEHGSLPASLLCYIKIKLCNYKALSTEENQPLAQQEAEVAATARGALSADLGPEVDDYTLHQTSFFRFLVQPLNLVEPVQDATARPALGTREAFFFTPTHRRRLASERASK